MKKQINIRKQIGMIVLGLWAYDFYQSITMGIQIPFWMSDQVYFLLAGLPILLIGLYLFVRPETVS